MLKAMPASSYPPEQGRYLRGNDYSPVAVAVILVYDQDEGDPDLLRRAVWSCYQEEPTSFQNCTLFDPGAYPEGPLSGRLTWRVTRPQAEPKDEGERQQRERLRDLMARAKRATEKKREREQP
jgi:hypothetical protein